MSTATLQQRHQDLLDHIRQGKIIEAMNEFYDKDTVMQENANPGHEGVGSQHRARKASDEWGQRVEGIQRHGVWRW